MLSKRMVFFTVLIIMALQGLISSAWAQKTFQVSGRTMGTTYQIKVVTETLMNPSALKAQIDQRLEQINQSMSTFRPESEISRFNAWQHTGRAFNVSEDFARVMMAGRSLYDLTQGAWDGTVTPLVLLWGFGKAGPIIQVPVPEVIARERLKVGFDAITISSKGELTKLRPGISVDLASIAKGYGVDQVALLLKDRGFDHFLVEIGGELFASGRRSDGQPWRVGINRPRKGGALDAVYKALPLDNRAMATSGDYRNFVEINGRSYSHIIDPRTGYPVANGVVSVSVIAENCTLADGLATALMVLGAEKGTALLNALKDVEGLIVVRTPDGTLIDHWSNGIQVN